MRCYVLLCALFLTACGSGSDSAGAPANPPPPPPPLLPPVGNQAPVASFVAPPSLNAAASASFDARASSDPEGSALIFSWDFGDGNHGGTQQIAHLYSTAGSYTVRLTVTDTQGLSNQTTRDITVAALAATPTVQINGLIMGVNGAPLAGVTVGVAGSASTVVSDSQGRVTLPVRTGSEVALRASRTGYSDQTQVLKLPASTGSDAYFETTLTTRATALTLSDAVAGGTLTGSDGVRLSLPPNALVTATGAAVTGAVMVTLTPLDINNSAALRAFPGRFAGLNPDGTQTPIVSYGTTEFTLTQNGQPLQLRPGARAAIDLPLYAGANLDGSVLTAGSTLPLWSLDERSGQWINEGNGTLVASTASPTALIMRAEVGHLSWWNADMGYTPYRPRPRCINDVPGQYDSIFEQATICKMLAEMDKPIPAQGASGFARALSAVSDVHPLAAPPRFRYPSTRIDGTLPIAGGVPFDVPPDFDMVLTGTALNGTWWGQVHVRGGQGATGDISVPLRPVTQGGTAEIITLPFDQLRAAAAARTDSYRFTATAGQGVTITVSQAESTLTGIVRLRNAANQLLMTTPFSTAAGTLQFQLLQAGDYTIEVVPVSNAPGGYRLQSSVQNVVERTPSVSLSMSTDVGVAKLATNATGTTFALWPEPQQGGLLLKASRYLDAATGWSAPETVASAPGLNTSVPLQLGLDDTGNVIAAWDLGSGPVVTRRSASSGVWSTAQPLASATCGGGVAQKLTVNTSGDATLLWRSSSTTGLCSSHYMATSGTWSTEQLVNTAAHATARFALESTANGDAIAAWVLAGPANTAAGVVVARYNATAASWSPTVPLAGTSATAPSLAVASDGAVLAAWWAFDTVLQQPVVDAAYLPAGSNVWSAPQRVGTNNGSFFLPQAVWVTGSRFQVVWLSTGGIAGREFSGSNGQWGAPLIATPARISATPVMARGGTGGVIVVWWANKITGSGTDLGFSQWNPDTSTWTMSPALLSPRPVVLPQAELFSDSASVVISSNGAVTMLWREGQPPGTPGATLQATQLDLTP
jgi:PKD repeat protein